MHKSQHGDSTGFLEPSPEDNFKVLNLRTSEVKPERKFEVNPSLAYLALVYT